MNDRAFINDMKRLAQMRATSVLAALGIQARPRGKRGTIAICDPMTVDTDPSLVIWTAMPGGISWKRYGSDAGGDIINLVSYLRGWWWLPHQGNPEATRWLADLLGLRGMNASQRASDVARAKRMDVWRENAATEARLRDGRRALGMWVNAHPIEGTRVEIYLNSRGIELDKLPVGPRGGQRHPSVLRYLHAHRHIDSANTETEWPCMIAACVDYSSDTPTIEAVHRTWLQRDGSGKAPVNPPRKVWPGFSGLVIPIWRGASRLSIAEAAKNGVRETLLITEGVEDGLTAAMLAPHLRVWAAISLNNMANVPLPECIDSVLLHKQDDWHSRQAIEAFENAKAELAAQGRPVEEFRPKFGAKDINDMVKAS